MRSRNSTEAWERGERAADDAQKTAGVGKGMVFFGRYRERRERIREKKTKKKTRAGYMRNREEESSAVQLMLLCIYDHRQSFSMMHRLMAPKPNLIKSPWVSLFVSSLPLLCLLSMWRVSGCAAAAVKKAWKAQGRSILVDLGQGPLYLTARATGR